MNGSHGPVSRSVIAKVNENAHSPAVLYWNSPFRPVRWRRAEPNFCRGVAIVWRMRGEVQQYETVALGQEEYESGLRDCPATSCVPARWPGPPYSCSARAVSAAVTTPRSSDLTVISRQRTIKPNAAVWGYGGGDWSSWQRTAGEPATVVAPPGIPWCRRDDTRSDVAAAPVLSATPGLGPSGRGRQAGAAAAVLVEGL